MRRFVFPFAVVLILAVGPVCLPAGTPYSLQAQLVETCSCDLFCPCFTGGKPTHHSCDAQVGFIIKKGNVGSVKLDGMKVHYAGVLGQSTYFTFEPSATEAQIDAFKQIAKAIYGDYWPAPSDIVKAPIDIQIAGDTATVKTKDSEVVLKKFQGENPAQPSVVQNVKYFNARNNGFVLYPAEKHEYTGHGQAFHYSKNNGFLIEIEAAGTL